MRGLTVLEFEEETGSGVHEAIAPVGGSDPLPGSIGGDTCGPTMLEPAGDTSSAGSKAGTDERGTVALLGDSGFKEAG